VFCSSLSSALTFALVLATSLLVSGCDVEKQTERLERQAERNMQNITNKVAADAEHQYSIVTKSGGTPIDICVHAGFVAAAYLQAKDESNYSKWKRIQGDDCRRAGVPQ